MADKLLRKEVFTIEYVATFIDSDPPSLRINATLNGQPLPEIPFLSNSKIPKPTNIAQTSWKRMWLKFEKHYSAAFIELLPARIGDAVLAASVVASDRWLTSVIPTMEPSADLARLIAGRARKRTREQQQLPGRGRPSKHTKAKLEETIRRCIGSYRRKNYGRSPTLPEVANELQMPVATLKSLLHRHGLRYSTYKKDA